VHDRPPIELADRFGVAVLDEVVVLGMGEVQLRPPALAVEHAELEVLVADDRRGAPQVALDAHPRPAVERVGDLVDEGVRVRHAPIVLRPPIAGPPHAARGTSARAKAASSSLSRSRWVTNGQCDAFS
jgi:hypothetical protein